MQNQRKFITRFLFVVGIFGGILFFPVLLDHHHNCAFDWLRCRVWYGGNHSENQRELNSANQISADQNDILSEYLKLHSWIWWFSVGLVAAVILNETTKRKISENNNQEE